MWNMQLCVAQLLVVSDLRYLQNSASGGVKTSFSDQKWQYFQSPLLRCKDMEYWRPPKDAACNTAYFTYPAKNLIINIGGLNWANCLGKSGTERAGSGCASNHYSRNSPTKEHLLTLLMADTLLNVALPLFPRHWIFPMAMVLFTLHCCSWSWASQYLVRPFTHSVLPNAAISSWTLCTMHGMLFHQAGHSIPED